MTRVGSTPYLQSRFRAVLEISGLAEGAWSVLEERAVEDSWDDWYAFYSEWRDAGVEALRISVRSVGPTGLEQYVKSSAAGIESLRAGLLIVGTESRVRRFIEGEVSLDVKNNVSVVVSVELEMAMLAGNYDIEPVVVVKSDLVDPRNGVAVTTGTVVGSSHSLRLKPTVRGGLLEDLFEFEWVKFGERGDLGVEDGDLFDLVLEGPNGRPTVYLNEIDEYSSFRGIMERPNPPSGRPSKEVKVRRALDSVIAAKVLEAAGAVVVNRIREIAAQRRMEDPEECEFGDIFEELTEVERSVIEGYIELFSRGWADDSPHSFCSDMATLSPADLKRHLESVMPRQIRRAMGAQDAVQNMLDLVDLARPGGLQ